MSRNLRTGGDGPEGEARRGITGVGGTMIMKSVSLFLANGRRASKTSGAAETRNRSRGNNMTLDGSTTDAAQRPRRRRSQAIEDSSGKINPKLLEAYKKKTHFSK